MNSIDPGATGIERPRPSALYRWSVLVFVSLAMFGNYYIYDTIAPLAPVLTEQLGFTDTNIGLLQAIYSAPNVIMVLLGGIIIDRIGARRASVLFGFLCLLGAVITAATPQVEIMAAGRLVFGIGAESLIVAITAALAVWFRGKELSFAFAINLTIARFGSWLAKVSPAWGKQLYENWQWPLLVAVGAGVICVVGAIIYLGMENNARRKYELGQEETEDNELYKLFKLDELVAIAVGLVGAFFVYMFVGSTVGTIGAIVLVAAGLAYWIVKMMARKTPAETFKGAFSFNPSFWLVVALCVTFYSGIFPFETFAFKFFENAKGMTHEAAGFLSGTLTLFAIIFMPIFGFVVDRVGKRSLFMMFGSALLIPVYVLMGFTDLNILIPVGMMGIAYALVPAVMWPSIAYVVDPKKLGTAYGLMTMIQNIGLTSFNMIIGWSNDYTRASETNPEGYGLGMLIFSVLGFFGMLFSFMLWRRESGPNAHGLETITTKTGDTKAA